MLAEEYQKFDSKKVNEINNKIWIISKKINYEKGLADFYTIEARSFQINGNYENSIKAIDNAIPIYSKLKNKKNYLFAIYLKSFNLLHLGSKTNYAINIAENALKIGEKTTHFSENAKLSYVLSTIYENQDNFKKSFFYLNKCIFYLSKSKEEHKIYACYNNFAIIYKKTNQLDKAIFYMKKAIFLDEKYNGGSQSRDLLTNIVDIYIKLKDYKKGLIYANLALSKGYRS